MRAALVLNPFCGNLCYQLDVYEVIPQLGFCSLLGIEGWQEQQLSPEPQLCGIPKGGSVPSIEGGASPEPWKNSCWVSYLLLEMHSQN